MAKEKKTENILIRVTSKEKEMIQRKAKEKRTTITAIVLSSIKNNITVNLDTSDYKDLVIQVQRIGNNINTILKRLHYSGKFERSDLLAIQNNQKAIIEEVKKERIKIKDTRKEIQTLRPNKLKKLLEKEGKEIPQYLIYDEIGEQINRKLGEFIDLVKKEKAPSVFRSFIKRFIETFYPTSFTYDELVSLSNEISEIIYKVNLKIITETGTITEDDFEMIMDVLGKYRKKRDDE